MDDPSSREHSPTADARSEFVHKPLSAGMIRLLRLKSLLHGNDIACDMIHCELENDYEYRALSYAWATNALHAQILVDGSKFTISTHLYAALRQAQCQDQDCILWIDQLCINQMDEDEKSDQVRKMKYIYARAWCVIVWLGLARDDSDLLMILLTVVAEQQRAQLDILIDNTSYVDILKIALERLRIQHNGRDPLPPQDYTYWIARLIRAFRSFCDRAYWKRLWVIQEFSVGRNVLIRCGRASLQSSDLKMAWDMVRRVHDIERNPPVANSIGELLKLSFDAPTRSFISGIITRRQTYRSGDTMVPLYDVMSVSLRLEHDYNQVQASDIRDRVFGLMGLATDEADFSLFPDYSMEPHRVYTVLAQRVLEQGYIDNLSNCQFPHNIGKDVLPTWVPDWSMHIRVSMCDRNNSEATGTYAASKPSFSPDLKSVTLEGVAVDYVSELGDEWDPDWLAEVNISAALHYLQDIWRFFTRSTRLRGKRNLFDWARFAIANRYNWLDEEFPVWLGVNWPEDLAGLTQDDQLEAAFYNLRFSERYLQSLIRLHSRRPFISRSGWVGLAPSHSNQGDRIVIFLGGRAAYILHHQYGSTYTLVGEAFVHGIMSGEYMTEAANIEKFTLV